MLGGRGYRHDVGLERGHLAMIQVVAELAGKLTSDYVFEDVGARMAEAVLAKLNPGASGCRRVGGATERHL